MGFRLDGLLQKAKWIYVVMQLCATAFVLFNILGYKRDKIEFDSRSGLLIVTKDNERIVMDFPAQPPVLCDIPKEIVKAFNIAPIECLKSSDFIVVFEREIDIETAKQILSN